MGASAGSLTLQGANGGSKGLVLAKSKHRFCVENFRRDSKKLRYLEK